MSKLNIELLIKVRDKIAATPEAYNQRAYASESRLAPCGTAACIAGWACVLSGRMNLETLNRLNDNDTEAIHETAAKELGLDESTADRLFTGQPHADEGYGWPEPFRSQWEDATRRDEPKVAIAYLDHIIATGKVP